MVLLGVVCIAAELKVLASPTQIAAPEQRHPQSSVALQLKADVVLPFAELKHLLGKIPGLPPLGPDEVVYPETT
jgi:hypothetical protein